jgi:iron complex outermembrane receptor protein
MYHSVAVGTEFGVPLGMIERIEVVRGPGSALYGTSAMFAVVNLVTKGGADFDGVQIAGELGSFGTRTLWLQAGQRFSNGFDFAVTAEESQTDGQNLYFREFDDPATNDGLARGLDWDDARKVVAVASFKGFGVTARYSSREKGVPTASWGMAFNDPRARTRGNWGGIELQYRDRLTPTAELSVRAHYDVYEYRGTFPNAWSNYQNATDADAAGLAAQLTWDPSSAYRLTAGGEFTRHLRADYRAWDEYGRYFDGDYPYTVSSGYAQAEAHVGSALALTAGLRHDDYTYAGTSTTPRLAVIATPGKGTSLKLLWGRAYRAPTNYEQFVVTATHAGPELGPETVETWELNAERRLARNLMAQASLYRYDVDGLIDQQSDDSTDSYWFANAGRMRATGAEAGFLLRAERVQADLNYGYQAASAVLTSEPMTNSPTHLLKGSASFLLPAGVRATWGQRYESGRVTVRGERTEPFSVANLAVVRRDVYRNADLTLLLRNVFDTRYSTPGGFEHRQVAIPQDGRTWALRLQWAF